MAGYAMDNLVFQLSKVITHSELYNSNIIFVYICTITWNWK